MEHIQHLESASSTNEAARDLVRQGAPGGTVVVADVQTAGRGRRGRTWFSPRGGLYLSYIHESALQPSRLVGITLDAATAVATALEDATGLEPSLRWPNDVILRGRKVGGVLPELHTEEGREHSVVVVGVGLNVNTPLSEFPEELHPIATSLREVTEWDHDLDRLARGIARRLHEKLSGYEYAGGPDLFAYRRRFPYRGRRVRLGTEEPARYATITNLAPDGALEVRREGAEEVEVVRSGEVLLVDGGA
ncbi:MAG: biotin--[acetyl-CoA-carboxylase] ligase [Myxococcota bacterium]